MARRKVRTKSAKQLIAYDIYCLKGMLVQLSNIQLRNEPTAPYGAAKLAIKEIIGAIKNV